MKSKGNFPNSFHAEALSLSLIPIFSSFTVSFQCWFDDYIRVRELRLTKGQSLFISYIDVRDWCWRRNLLVTILRCRWRLRPFKSPISFIRRPIKICVGHEYPKDVAKTLILSPTFLNCHQHHNATNMTVALFIWWSQISSSYGIIQGSVCIYFIHIDFIRDLNLVYMSFLYWGFEFTWSLLQFLFLWNLNLKASNLHPSGTAAPVILYFGFSGLFSDHFNRIPHSFVLENAL